MLWYYTANIDWWIRIICVLKPLHRMFSCCKRAGMCCPFLKKQFLLGFNKTHSRLWRKQQQSWWAFKTWSNRDGVCVKLGCRWHIQQVQEHLLPITHVPYLRNLFSVHLLRDSFIAISIPSCWRDWCHQPCVLLGGWGQGQLT